VSDFTGGTVTPVSTATNIAGPPIPVGREPAHIAITPDGTTAYVIVFDLGGQYTLTPIATATNKAGPPIKAGKAAEAIAITP
jgi:DNA-binding beta-propeller fold protein YncE